MAPTPATPPTPSAPHDPVTTATRRAGAFRAAAASVRRWLGPRAAAPGAPDAARAPDTPTTAGSYPGDFTGPLVPVYDPHPDGLPDPGEIVWTWVPFEEDHRQGKDRPVLVIGRDGDWLLALQLTSKDHDCRPPRADHRRWVDIGSGGWDRQGRPSEVRVDRVVRVDPGAVRREGAVLSQQRFEDVARAVAERDG